VNVRKVYCVNAVDGPYCEFDSPQEAKDYLWHLAGSWPHVGYIVKEIPIPEPPPVDRSNICTTDGKPPIDPNLPGAPGPIKANGQHEQYWVLCEEERKKGFVRPVRESYVHVGIRPKYPVRDLTDEERERFGTDWAKYEEYPKGSTSTGRFWTEAELKSGCRTSTRMALSLAETYARDPSFYGSTFCVNCGKHFPVKEFVWKGTDEVLGS
jgi:hypothetical protein